MTLSTYKSEAVRNMIFGIEGYAKNKGISLKNSIPEDVNDFDDLFNDNGEGRHDYFTIESYNYSKQFGEFDDYENGNGCESHIHSCIESAMAKLQKKYNK